MRLVQKWKTADLGIMMLSFLRIKEPKWWGQKKEHFQDNYLHHLVSKKPPLLSLSFLLLLILPCCVVHRFWSLCPCLTSISLTQEHTDLKFHHLVWDWFAFTWERYKLWLAWPFHILVKSDPSEFIFRPCKCQKGKLIMVTNMDSCQTEFILL